MSNTYMELKQEVSLRQWKHQLSFPSLGKQTSNRHINHHLKPLECTQEKCFACRQKSKSLRAIHWGLYVLAPASLLFFIKPLFLLGLLPKHLVLQSNKTTRLKTHCVPFSGTGAVGLYNLWLLPIRQLVSSSHPSDEIFTLKFFSKQLHPAPQTFQ